MRLRLCNIVLVVALVGCGAAEVADQTTLVDTTPPQNATSAPASPARDQTTLAGPPQWEGFEPTRENDPLLAAYASTGPVDVYGSPGGTEPLMTIEGTTVLGTVTVLGVVSEPVDGWVEVMLPVRPNGSTGWVDLEDVSLYVVDGEITIDLSDRRLTYVVDGVEVLTTDVGIGSDHNQTPIGEFFVTDNVTLADANSPWGPHALGLSARSETITEFNGGDGIIGIHGTNNPGSIGGNISLGCVRLPNDMITALHEMVPLGTRVSVRA